MFGGLDPKKMQAVMKQMGIKQEEVDSARVIIEKNDGGKILINNPNVVKIKMQGQESWQITGDNAEKLAIENSEKFSLEAMDKILHANLDKYVPQFAVEKKVVIPSLKKSLVKKLELPK
jgi:NACalpha-BTF3-like transcription factor